MSSPTKAELQSELADLRNLHQVAATLRALDGWDREAKAISGCVRALDPITSTAATLRTEGRGSVGRILQYLAARHGVPMADPKVLEDLMRERDELRRSVAAYEAAGVDR